MPEEKKVNIPPQPKKDVFRVAANAHSHVKKVIAVVSGKGGVGKSAVTGMCALWASRRGYKTAILDADITGPSIPKMFGVTPADLAADENGLLPAVTATGIKIMSMNLMMQDENQPVIWRSPVITDVLKQFWSEVSWGDVDCMFIDMPPGTGDVTLTVFQSLPIDGLIIVTSPQELVGMIVEKCVKMAQMMNIPVLAMVENMGYVQCPHCGEKLWPYGPSHLTQTADEYGIDALGELPIDPALAAACDHGTLEEELPQGFLPKAVAAVVSTCEFDDAKASSGAAE